MLPLSIFVLGLGSNLGFPLDFLRKALGELKKLNHEFKIKAVSPVYGSEAQLNPGAPEAWQKNFLNIAVACKNTKKNSPEKILTLIKKIEKKMGRLSVERWSPRIIDIDILAWEGLSYQTAALTLPHACLMQRPFALLPLLDMYPDFEHPVIPKKAIPWLKKSAKIPFKTQRLHQRLTPPDLMGIVNITPDSFSDGASFESCDAIFNRIHQFIKQGAVVIDLGAEASNPDVLPLDAETEWQRLSPVLERLPSQAEAWLFKPLISLDTYHPETVKQLMREDLLGSHVHIINDVSSQYSDAISGLIKKKPVFYSVMHNCGIPASRTQVLSLDGDPVKTVYQWGEKKIYALLKKGLCAEQIIFDPGIGFGKTAAQSWEILKHAHVFKSLGVKILIGHSRKSFLNAMPFMGTRTLRFNRDLYTSVLSYALGSQSMDYLRVHDVKKNRQALAVLDKMQDLIY